jgi:hypothetical protein
VASPLRSLELTALRIVDVADYRRARLDLAFRLVDGLRAARVRFLVPARPASWDRVAFLNLTFWTADAGELMPSREVTMDTLCHVAWHQLARRHLGASAREASLAGEAVASAFDLYLVGRLLRAAPRARYLHEQVPRMAERAAEAGVHARAFERWLERVATAPEWAFGQLRALLYDAACTLAACRDTGAAARALARFDRHPFAPLLHHYELSNWILHTRAHASRRASPRAQALDRALRRSAAPVTDLARLWSV